MQTAADVRARPSGRSAWDVRPSPTGLLLESLTIGALAVVVVATGRAIARGYGPLDDNGVIELRARDVLGGGPLPLVGAVSSASQGGELVHHPGPLLYDLLSVPVRLLPGGIGVAVGAALINCLAIVAIAVAARRLLGSQGAAVVIAAVAGLVWSMGSEGLFEAWLPIVTMLPFLLALVATWSWAAGNETHAVLVVVATSLCVQTHGSYLLLGPSLVLVGLASSLADRRRRSPRRWPLFVAGSAGLVLWLQPLVDLGFGEHNLARIVRRAAGGDELPRLGPGDAVRAAAMVLVKPPWWSRPGMASTLPTSGGLVRTDDGRVFDPDWISLPVAATGMVVLVTALVVAVWFAGRRGDRVVVGGGIVGLIAVAASVVTLAGLPVDDFGFTAHKARWLWPLGVYITAYLVAALLRSTLVTDRRHATVVVGSFGGLALVASMSTSYQGLSPQQFEVARQDATGELRAAAAALEGRGLVFLDLAHRPFPDAYNDPFAAELAKRGIEFRVTSDYVVGQYGEPRRLDPEVGADVTVRVLVGNEALFPPPEFEVIAEIGDAPQPLALGVSEFVAPSG